MVILIGIVEKRSKFGNITYGKYLCVSANSLIRTIQ